MRRIRSALACPVRCDLLPCWVLAAAAAAGVPHAGCFSDRGVAIEVDVGTTGASAVELFLGKTACSDDNAAGIDCRAIAPPPAGAPALRGQIWFRDDVAVDTARVDGHTAAFRLRSDDAATIPFLIAVGEDAGGNGIAAATLTDLTVPVHTARVVKIALTPAAPVVPGGPAPRTSPEDRVLVWRKDTPPSSCVVVEHWEADAPTRSFVVPEQDPDCDDVASECNPAAWHGMANAGSAFRPDCLTKTNGVCLLGSHACMDGSGSTGSGACTPQHDDAVCVPDQLCGCAETPESCVRTAARNTPAIIPHVDCSFPAENAISLCKDKASATIQLDHFPPGQTCRQPLITSLVSGDFATRSAFGGAIMELTGAQPPCTFSIAWKEGDRNPLDPIDVGAIKVPTSSGAVLIPLVLHFNPVQVNTCGTVLPPSCQLKDVVTDSMWDCTQ